MIPLWEEPLMPAPPGPLPTDAEQAARCAYLAAVQAAQHHCEQRCASARADFIIAERDAWHAYQAASDTAVRNWDTPSYTAPNRWFTPPANSHPLTQMEK